MSEDRLLQDVGREALAKQPFSVLLGAELVELSAGHAVLRVPVTSQVLQQFGYVHGGLISYVADNALTFAGGSVLGIDVVMAEFKINYLRPAVGAVLMAQARCVHAGRRQAVCVSEIYTADAAREEHMCAIAQGTIVKSSAAAARSARDFPRAVGTGVG